jgi:hypothetical protein
MQTPRELAIFEHGRLMALPSPTIRGLHSWQFSLVCIPFIQPGFHRRNAV